MNEDLKDAAKLAFQIIKRRPLRNSLFAGLIILGSGMKAISDETNARIALEQRNYSNIQLLGPDFFNCSKEEIFGTRARATNQEGNIKDVVVCREPRKSATTIIVLAGPRS